MSPTEFKDQLRHIEGLELLTDASNNKAQKITHGQRELARCSLSGTDGKGVPCKIPIDDILFGKHLLLLGNIGTGKTNAIFQIITQLQSKMAKDDIMVIFDTKGDFYNKFYREGDIVISNDTASFSGNQDYWNILSEILIDKTERSIKENALEIANTLFTDKIKNTTQPFFPQAAKDILATFLTLCAEADASNETTNKAIVEHLECSTRASLLEEFQEQNEEQGGRLNRLSSYLTENGSAMADSILSDLYQLLSEIFIGDFREDGYLSIRELIRNKGGKTIFIEYDITVGSILAPIYRLLFDLAIKESLGKKRGKGNVWFVIDEFSLIPNLLHIDSGINFGRSQGLKFIIGVQNIPQIYKAYGEHAAESLLSGLSTVISFRVDDKKSRDFIQHRYGNSLKKLIFKKTGQVGQGQIAEEVRQAQVIEDWVISGLSVGQAIVGIPNADPFLFKFDESK